MEKYTSSYKSFIQAIECYVRKENWNETFEDVIKLSYKLAEDSSYAEVSSLLVIVAMWEHEKTEFQNFLHRYDINPIAFMKSISKQISKLEHSDAPPIIGSQFVCQLQLLEECQPPIYSDYLLWAFAKSHDITGDILTAFGLNELILWEGIREELKHFTTIIGVRWRRLFWEPAKQLVEHANFHTMHGGKYFDIANTQYLTEIEKDVLFFAVDEYIESLGKRKWKTYEIELLKKIKDYNHHIGAF